MKYLILYSHHWRRPQRASHFQTSPSLEKSRKEKLLMALLEHLLQRERNSTISDSKKATPPLLNFQTFSSKRKAKMLLRELRSNMRHQLEHQRLRVPRARKRLHLNQQLRPRRQHTRKSNPALIKSLNTPQARLE